MFKMADEVVEEICPSVEILTSIETAVPCPVKDCSKILFNTASLRMHVIKTHNITENEEDKALFTRNSEKKKSSKKHFYCPILDCTRGKSSRKPFPRLGQLKQHYMTVHAEKQHTCKKCNRGYGLLAACKRHESKCGQLFHCSCGCPFTTREALLMHARRKQHSLPAKEQIRDVPNNKQTTRMMIPVQVKPANILTTTTVNQGKVKTSVLSRYCKILPKPVNSPKQDSTSSLGFTKNSEASVITQDAGTQTSQPKCLKNISTQTVVDLSHENPEIMSSSTSIGTQANNLLNTVSMTDFSIQVMVPDTDGNMNGNMNGNICQSSSIGIQHDHLFVPNHSSLGIQDDPTCFSLSSQTLLTGSNPQITDPQFLSTSETQTQDYSQVALEDNASQTSISIFDLDPSISTDCGTQTQAQKMFDELWNQSDVELTESQTQTWFSSLVSAESEITNQNQILNNRTALDDLVNMQTQTSCMTNNMTFDAGFTNTETQTIPEAFATNSWAFEQMNRQTQMTQTATEDVMYNQLMDTYTQTFLDDMDVSSLFSSVQTQT